MILVGAYGDDDNGYNSGAVYCFHDTRPKADFIADKDSGIIPLTIHFTDNSTGEISEWSCDFGDFSTSAEQNPSHTYIDEGTYSVSLTVTRSSGNDTEIKTGFITVSTQTDLLDQTTVRKAVIFPNPCKTVCTVKVPDHTSGIVTIKIYNLNGEEILSNYGIADKFYEMNLSNLASGMYYLSIISEHSISTEKLIVIE